MTQRLVLNRYRLLIPVPVIAEPEYGSPLITLDIAGCYPRPVLTATGMPPKGTVRHFSP